jgi:hypothetical protein
VKVEVHVVVTGEMWLHEVLDLYKSRIHIHQLHLEDPRQLPLEAVRHLLDATPVADLSMYLEDDLVIQDPLYIDKQAWFHQRTDHRFVLMPHRYEPTIANSPKRFFVDGPIKEDGCSEEMWIENEAVIAHGRFWDGQDLSFARALNPHSGTFCISVFQVDQLRSRPWPPEEFVGPLETAATGSVFGHFEILKPS